MSTRGFVTFVVDGEEKTVFNHWDSYPSALGLDVLEFVRGTVNWAEEFLRQVRELRMVSREHATTGVIFDVEGNLARVLKAGAAISDVDFPRDSLFAEWGYVIDLDALRLEIYRGFQKKPHERGRFANRPPIPRERSPLIGTYYPVALVMGWSFTELPSAEAFLAAADLQYQHEEQQYQEEEGRSGANGT